MTRPPADRIDRLDLIDIVENRIDAGEVLETLPTAGDGALALFLGIVRDENEGRRVLRLEYHTYREMALRKLAAIAAEARSRLTIRGLALIHRVGTLDIGEVAVLVAVASSHRAEAFDACRGMMERIKHEVPIWKKEHFEGGEAWVEGCRPDLNSEESR